MISTERKVGDIGGPVVLYVTMKVWSEREFAYQDYVFSVRNGDSEKVRRAYHLPPMQMVVRAKVY